MKTQMKIKIFTILFLISIVVNAYPNESFITGTGKTYGEARSFATKVVFSQGLKIIGQNYNKDKNGNWTIVLKVRPKRNVITR